MQVQNNFNTTPNFNGIHVARSTNVVDGVKTTIDLYKTTFKDESFMLRLRDKIYPQSLMPDKRLSQLQFDRWRFMVEYAITKGFSRGEECYLAAVNKKPCGVISYKNKSNRFYLDGICTWPVEVGKKVKMAGQTLIKHMFEDFKESEANLIDLTAITDGPYSAVSKYMRLGFKQTGGEDGVVTMRTNRETVDKTLEKLNQSIETTKFDEHGADENLLDVLSV